MNMEYMKYAAAVNEIAGGFFDGKEYLPNIGKGNIVRVFCEFVSDNEAVKKLDIKEMGAFDYVNKCLELVGAEFAQALKDDDFFSFGSAIKDAEKMVKFRLDKLSHESKFESALEAIIKKVNEIDKNVNPEDITKVLDALKEQKPLDEGAIVEEYWKQKDNKDGEKRA